MSTQVLSIDWLAYSVTLALSYSERAKGIAELHAPKGYTLVECKHGTPQYKRRLYLLTDEGDKVATLLLQPHSHIIDHRDMYVEIANPYLYAYGGIAKAREVVAACHEASFRSLSRFDVACDFQPTPHQSAIISGLESMTHYVQGKGEGAQFHDYHYQQGSKVQRKPRQLSWGGKQSSVKWKLYNKSLELHQTDDSGRTWCDKPYIPAYWQAHGMGSTGVWRLECSLTGASSFSWRGEKMTMDIVDGDWETWYYDMVATRFVIRENQGHQCRKNDPAVTLIDIPDAPHHRLREWVGDRETARVDHATTLRLCIHELERPEVAYSKPWRDLWLQTTSQVLNQGNLHGYFERVTGMGFDEWATTIGDPYIPAQ